MSRTISITFDDLNPIPGADRGAIRVAGRGARRVLRLSDPGEGGILADPDDPGEGGLLAEPDDPGEGGLLAEPDDPGEGGLLAEPDDPDGISSAPPVVVYSSSASPCCCHPCADGARSTAAIAGPGSADYSGWVIVRLGENYASASADFPSLVELAHDEKFPELAALARALALGDAGGAPMAQLARLPGAVDPPAVDDAHLPSRPLIRNLCFEQRRDPPIPVRAALRELEQSLVGRWPHPGPSLLRYWRIDCRRHPERVLPLLAALRGLPQVDLAYRELLATDSSTADPSASPYGSGQSYLDDAPVGIGARSVWSHVPQGQVRLIDVEQRWVLDHLELASAPKVPLFGDNRYQTKDDDGHHGTAVLAQLAATGTNVEGIASKVANLDVASHYDAGEKSAGNVAEAIVNALLRRELGLGDILLLEVQRSGGPTELDLADATAIQVVVAKGVTVIEPAGNGALDLDAQRDPFGRRSLRRGTVAFRETGAVMVGAGYSSLPHNRSPFSSFGSRLDCYGWGDSVCTAGYGDLDPGNFLQAQMYTRRFAGTSSASPIVAGAAVLLQAIYRDRSGTPLAPRRMREILSDPATGTPQGRGVAGRIGVMPNLGAIVGGVCGFGPRLYLRHGNADDVFPFGPEERPCFSSPDVFAASKPSLGKITAAPGGHGENALAPGLSPLPSGDVFLFAWARNRGQGDATGVGARFYAAEIATFIGPRAWRLVGEKGAATVPQGGMRTRIGALKGAPGSGHRALLAMLTRPDDTPEKDPLPRLSWCYDAAEYHRFLERPEVACRNVHWASPTDTLGFKVTGTPDHAHTFQFQLLQRLPAGVAVELKTTSRYLAALLAQSQPALAKSYEQPVAIPTDPCLLFDDVRLPKDACFEATLRLTSPSGVQRRHRIVLRQLLRGREIGRITWYFV